MLQRGRGACTVQYQKYMYVCTFGHGLPIYMYMENAARICTLIWKIQRGTQGENNNNTTRCKSNPAGDMYMYSYMYNIMYNIMMCFSTTNTHTHTCTCIYTTTCFMHVHRVMSHSFSQDLGYIFLKSQITHDIHSWLTDCRER